MRHTEHHRLQHNNWLRAAVLGANDGILSTASIVLGVAASGGAHAAVLIAGVAGIAAGAMSMAAGEYVSVSTQSDTENADLAREKEELATQPDAEKAELAGIYVGRGLDPQLARQVAEQLMAHDALGTHARDELGITEMQRARPILAAFASAGSFAAGGIVPLLIVVLVPPRAIAAAIVATTLLCLAGLGALAAHAGGASPKAGAVRVTFWGALAMALTYAIGKAFGVAMG